MTNLRGTITEAKNQNSYGTTKANEPAAIMQGLLPLRKW